MIIVSKPSKAIRAPIVWNRPTAGMFDYHYDLAGLYYQVVVIALNAKALVKETDTPPPADDQLLSRARGGWSSEGGRLARSSRVQLWQESLVRCFFSPSSLVPKKPHETVTFSPCLWPKRHRVWLQHTRSWWRRLWQVLDDDVPTQDEGQERQIK